MQRQRGVTLIELVVAVTIVAMAAAAVLGGMSAITKRGANVMVQQQAVAVAEAYLEEILLKPVADPGGTVTDRSAYDVDDYNGLVGRRRARSVRQRDRQSQPIQRSA